LETAERKKREFLESLNVLDLGFGLFYGVNFFFGCFFLRTIFAMIKPIMMPMITPLKTEGMIICHTRNNFPPALTTTPFTPAHSLHLNLIT